MTLHLLEQLIAPETLHRSWPAVAAKRGAAGIDRVTVDHFAADLSGNVTRLCQEISSGSYKPAPVVRIRPRFLEPSDRPLVVPTVRDRLVQRSIADLLNLSIEPTLSPSCRAFRRGSSAQAAADDVGRWIAEGRPWILRADIRSFFDTIDRDLLQQKLAPFVDEPSLAFLERIVRCRVFDQHQVSEMVVGISQGSPLSPLLANLFLNELDQALTKQCSRYLRYCDDFIALETAEENVREALTIAQQHLNGLKLTLNDDKTRICRAEDGFVYLGYEYGATGRGPAVKAVAALHFRLEELSSGPELDISGLDAVFRGWTNYFGDHPRCWTEHPAGILALLRKANPDQTQLRALAAARWQLEKVPHQLGLGLGHAWCAVGLAEQAWFELATSIPATAADLAIVTEWAALLAVNPDKLRAILRSLVGAPEERLTTLSNAAAELGLYAVAEGLVAFGPDPFVGTTAPLATAFSPEQADEDDIGLLAQWFQGREGVHAVESVNRSGHRCFKPVPSPIGAEQWQAHLAGERTLALALIRADQTALIGVLDVDIEKRVLDSSTGVPDSYLGRALGAAIRLRQELQRRGCASLLELSGRKGYHLWVRFDGPVKAADLRRWLLDVIQVAGPLPEGIRAEEFPNRDRVRSDAVGPLIKLPLGVHSRTGQRCLLLDEQGNPLADPLSALGSLTPVPPDVVRTWVETRHSERLASTPPRKIGAKVASLLVACHVLRALHERAQQVSYLTHGERQIILCTLGHLGAEGGDGIHAIISHCHNYRAEITQRQITKMPSAPISCPRIRERLPQVTAGVGCNCQFKCGAGVYPSPVLHVLKPNEVKAFRPPAKKPARTKGEQGRPATDDPAKLHGEAEQKVRKIAELKRHRRGIDSSIERLGRELAALFDEAGQDTIEVSIGILRRVKSEDGKGWDFRIEV